MSSSNTPRRIYTTRRCWNYEQLRSERDSVDRSPVFFGWSTEYTILLELWVSMDMTPPRNFTRHVARYTASACVIALEMTRTVDGNYGAHWNDHDSHLGKLRIGTVRHLLGMWGRFMNCIHVCHLRSDDIRHGCNSFGPLASASVQ